MSVTEPLPSESDSAAAPASMAGSPADASPLIAVTAETTGTTQAADRLESSAADAAQADPSVQLTTSAEPSAVIEAAGDPGADLSADPGAQPASGTTPQEPGLSPGQTANRLAELFPALFAGPPKPIKLRIQVDIQQRAPGIFTKRVMSIFLSRHTTTTPYLKALLAETQRFDLDGQPAGEIAAEHKQAATEELARRRQIVEQRRAAERASRPPRSATEQRRRPADEASPQPPGSEAAAPVAEGKPADDRRQRPPRRPPPPRRFDGPAGERPVRPERAPDHRSDSRPAHRPQDGQGRPAERGQGPQHQQHPARQQRQDHHDRPNNRTPNAHRSDAHNARPQAPAPREWAPSDPAQRERAALLRTWESSSLTKANFCVLKRMSEVEFDAQLEQARQERAAARAG